MGLISHRSGRGLDGHSSLRSFPTAEGRDSRELAPPTPLMTQGIQRLVRKGLCWGGGLARS